MKSKLVTVYIFGSSFLLIIGVFATSLLFINFNDINDKLITANNNKNTYRTDISKYETITDLKYSDLEQKYQDYLKFKYTVFVFFPIDTPESTIIKLIYELGFNSFRNIRYTSPIDAVLEYKQATGSEYVKADTKLPANLEILVTTEEEKSEVVDYLQNKKMNDIEYNDIDIRYQ
jgi:hypothetical protein